MFSKKLVSAGALLLGVIATVHGKWEDCTTDKPCDCGKPVCLYLDFDGKEAYTLGSIGSFYAIHGFINEGPEAIKVVRGEHMQTKAGTDRGQPIVPCKQDTNYCFQNREYVDRIRLSDEYEHNYKMDLRALVLDHKKMGFNTDSEAMKHMKVALYELWKNFQAGRNYFGTKIEKEFTLDKYCPAVFGGTYGYTVPQKCIRVCDDHNNGVCYTTCMKAHKPVSKCTGSGPRSEVPAKVALYFRENITGNILGQIVVTTSEPHVVSRPSKPFFCTDEFEAIVGGLSFVPKVGTAVGFFGFATDVLCDALGARKVEQDSNIAIPDDLLLIPRDQGGDANETISDSAFECSKCWTLDSSSGESPNENMYIVPKEQMEEFKHCDLCFLQQQVLDEGLDFTKAINYDCESVNQYSVKSLLNLLPSNEASVLRTVQEQCRSSRGSSEFSMSNGAVAGIAVGATAAAFSAVGIVLLKKNARESDVPDPVLESFNTKPMDL